MNQRAQKLQNRLLINTYPNLCRKTCSCYRIIQTDERRAAGGKHMQSNVVDRETLRNAQERPEQAGT